MRTPRAPLFLVAVVGLLATGRPDARQAGLADQPIFDDRMVNGWTSNTLPTINLAAASPVHSGGRSIALTLDNGQSLNLRHDFRTAGYSAIRFWVHGGSRGGQRLRLRVQVGNVSQTPVDLAPLVANAWQQISVPLSSLVAASQRTLNGILISALAAGQPEFFVDDVSLALVSPPATVRLTINADQVVRTAEARHFGIQTSVWDKALDSADTVALLTENGNQALRFPGGSQANDYHWATNASHVRKDCVATVNRLNTPFDGFARVAIASQAQQVFVTVNYGSGTPAEAADWVRYSNLERIYGFKYWEVGNENYGDWETDCQQRRWDPFIYATRFKDYSTQMKDVDPSIKVGAVVENDGDKYSTYTDHPATNPRTGRVHNSWTPVMLATLRSLGVTPDFVIYHRYDQEPGRESDADVLQSSSGWTDDAADLRQQLIDYLGADAAARVELVCTENNSVSARPGKQSISIVNALFLADSLGQLLQTEFNSHFWHDLRNGPEANNNAEWLYGWRIFGDYGLVSYDAANPTAAFVRYPAFYATKLFQHFARGGDRIVRATSDYPWLSVYAARRANGTLTLLVINKTPVNTLNASIAVSGYTPATEARVLSYGQREDDAARTGPSDLTETRFGGASANFAYSFPPYSVTVMVLAAGQ